jgi:hypothetical protein
LNCISGVNLFAQYFFTQDCRQVKSTNYRSCFAIYILHQIGLNNLTLAKATQAAFVNTLAQDPYAKNVNVNDNIYSGK